MAASADNWSLFGYDLRKVGDYARLGFEQLLFDPTSWLARKLAPTVTIWSSNGEVQGRYCNCTLHRDPQPETHQKNAQDQGYHALLLPEDAVLLKHLTVPVAVEHQLDAIVASDVVASSPFPAASTRSAWAVIRRSDQLLVVAVAITSSEAIEHCLIDWQALEVDVGIPQEVWVLADDTPIVFKGYGEDSRRGAVVARLAQTAFAGALLWLMALLALWVPATVTSIRAEQLEDALFDLRAEAATATQARTRLLVASDRLAILQEALTNRANYGFWLEDIANIAPDDVYFERLKLEGASVEASGHADNAASYLRMLTEQAQYSDVEAGAAFVRNQRTGLEVFTISWQLQFDQVPE